jgi:hypothetical protein
VQFREVVMSGKYITSLENSLTSLENTSPVWSNSLHLGKHAPPGMESAVLVGRIKIRNPELLRHQRIATIFPLFGKCSNKPSNRPVFVLLVPDLEAYNISLSQKYGITVHIKKPLSGHGDKLHIKRHTAAA